MQTIMRDLQVGFPSLSLDKTKFIEKRYGCFVLVSLLVVLSFILEFLCNGECLFFFGVRVCFVGLHLADHVLAYFEFVQQF